VIKKVGLTGLFVGPSESSFCCAPRGVGTRRIRLQRMLHAATVWKGDRPLSPPFRGGARGGGRCNSQCAWTPFSVGFCKGRAVQLDFRGGCPHPPWPPLRKGGTKACWERGNEGNKTRMNTQPVEAPLFISPGPGGVDGAIRSVLGLSGPPVLVARIDSRGLGAPGRGRHCSSLAASAPGRRRRTQ